MLRFEFVYSLAPARPPRVSVITFTSYICCIYALNFGQYRTLFCHANSSFSKRLFLCSFCSVRSIASNARFCLRLLSDSASRRTPLSLADSSYCHACSGLSPPSYYTCRAHTWHSPPVSDDRWAVLCLLFHLLFEVGSHFFETAFFPTANRNQGACCPASSSCDNTIYFLKIIIQHMNATPCFQHIGNKLFI